MLANFWPRTPHIPDIESQYTDLWRFAKALDAIGVPLGNWHPPADTPSNALLNKAFDNAGVTAAALAMAKADKDNQTNIRSLGAWNGLDDEDGGIAFTTMLDEGPFPCTLDFSAYNVAVLKDHRNVLRLLQSILDIWSPVLLTAGPYAYTDKAVFQDRPPVSWMIYLPFAIGSENVPEASLLIPVLDDEKRQKGTIIVSVDEAFDAKNSAHVKRANDIEIRLADQDLLPRFADFMRIR